MKRFLSILIAMAVMIVPSIAEAQNQITRPSKKKSEQTSGNKPNNPAKRNNGSSGSVNNSQTKRSPKPLKELDPVIQNLINNMVYVEGGSSMLGSDDSDALYSEEPHRESVGSFHIGKYEVTQKEWKVIMGNNPSHFKGDDLPVECVSWDDCQEFIKKLNSLTGKEFRLPTNEEWEYAAKGGNRSMGYKYSGSNDIDKVAWYEKNSESKTHTVGTKDANELGLHDMTGNVVEWTSNKWSYNFSEPHPFARGGSWSETPFNSRLARKLFYEPKDNSNIHGLRLIF